MRTFINVTLPYKPTFIVFFRDSLNLKVSSRELSLSDLLTAALWLEVSSIQASWFFLVFYLYLFLSEYIFFVSIGLCIFQFLYLLVFEVVVISWNQLHRGLLKQRAVDLSWFFICICKNIIFLSVLVCIFFSSCIWSCSYWLESAARRLTETDSLAHLPLLHPDRLLPLPHPEDHLWNLPGKHTSKKSIKKYTFQ